jgi:hypothetical protein
MLGWYSQTTPKYFLFTFCYGFHAEHTTFWEAASCSAAQEIHSILWTNVHKSLTNLEAGGLLSTVHNYLLNTLGHKSIHTGDQSLYPQPRKRRAVLIRDQLTMQVSVSVTPVGNLTGILIICYIHFRIINILCYLPHSFPVLNVTEWCNEDDVYRYLPRITRTIVNSFHYIRGS